MDKLEKMGISNAPPSPKQTKAVVAEEYNKVVEKINNLIDDSIEFINTSVTDFTLLPRHINKYIRIDNEDAISVTIPEEDIEYFPIGSVITLEQTGGGTITVEGAEGIIINGNFTSGGQYMILVLIKTSTSNWTCIGGILDE